MATILKLNPDSPKPEFIAQAAALIRKGEVIAIPTDTLYGLAADPFQPAAVERVFRVKGRPPDAPVPLLVDSLEMAASLARRLPDSFRRCAERYWPGPLTLVVEAAERIPDIVTAGTGQVGLRLPASAVPQALARALGGPITGTSANLSGQPECHSAAETAACLGELLPLILDGGASRGTQPSTVVRLGGEDWELIREGAISRSEIEIFLGRQKS